MYIDAHTNIVDYGFLFWSGQIKDDKIDICCLTAKPATLRRKREDRLARNHDNVSEWNDMPSRKMLFQ